MIGGDGTEPVTEKVSVRQLVANDTPRPVRPTAPYIALAMVTVDVLGPVIAKLMKSSRS